MDLNQEELNQIVRTLSKHFEILFYVDIETGQYTGFTGTSEFDDVWVPNTGENFFERLKSESEKYVHPDDCHLIAQVYDKDIVRENLLKNASHSIVLRMYHAGKIVHMRHIGIMCSDKRHFLCCLENIEKEFKEKEEQKKNLKSAEIMARRDEMTGVRNQNAFKEYVESLDRAIREKKIGNTFGLVMCDINDLKLINDTRGHSFGDEAIQRASRMICEIYKHSPVFRVGGDEFIVVLTGNDFEERDRLLEKLQEESLANRLSRSGPVIACGMAVFDSENDENFESIYKRSDKLMYENKYHLKSSYIVNGFRKMENLNEPIPDERKRCLDAMFGALITVAGQGYIYLNDMQYDFSRWSLSLIDDFALASEYMYHADAIWYEYIHPDDKEIYKDAIDAVLSGNPELKPIKYRARKANGEYVTLYTRGFVLCDSNGEPEYFGGIILPV